MGDETFPLAAVLDPVVVSSKKVEDTARLGVGIIGVKDKSVVWRTHSLDSEYYIRCDWR